MPSIFRIFKCPFFSYIILYIWRDIWRYENEVWSLLYIIFLLIMQGMIFLAIHIWKLSCPTTNMHFFFYQACKMLDHQIQQNKKRGLPTKCQPQRPNNILVILGLQSYYVSNSSSEKKNDIIYWLIGS